MLAPDQISPNILAGILNIPLEKLSAISRAAHRLYTVSHVPKKDGGRRLIEAPYKDLRKVHRLLNKKVLAGMQVHPALHGRPHTSQLTAAGQHVGQPMLVTMDVRDFFPSVTSAMVKAGLMEIGFPSETADIITRLCTREKRLPQGAPTSPVLSRIVITKVLYQIEGLFRAISPHCSITQFVDDLAVSGPIGIHRAIPALHKIWRRHGFIIHPNKTKVMRQSERQEILGVWVNRRLEPTEQFLEKLAKAKASLPPDDSHRRGLEAFHRDILKQARKVAAKRQQA